MPASADQALEGIPDRLCVMMPRFAAWNRHRRRRSAGADLENQSDLPECMSECRERILLPHQRAAELRVLLHARMNSRPGLNAFLSFGASLPHTSDCETTAKVQ